MNKWPALNDGPIENKTELLNDFMYRDIFQNVMLSCAVKKIFIKRR